LISKLRARDPDAIAAVYDKYAGLAYSVLFRVTRNRGAAEDLLQELFLRVWNRALLFDPEKGTIGVWILSVARNLAIDHVRSAQTRFLNRQRSIEPTDELSFSYKTSEPESLLDNAATIRRALSELNEKQRRVMEMAYFEGFSQSEIAAELQEPLGTVKSWMRSGIERLRGAIRPGVDR
jgi:RNA polymerase sigma-70 factor (ECF subfamily)